MCLTLVCLLTPFFICPPPIRPQPRSNLYIMLKAITLAALVATAAAAPDVILATFDGADKATTFKWRDLNDPVSLSFQK